MLFLADENFNNDIVRGLLRRKTDLDIVRGMTTSRHIRSDPPPVLRAISSISFSGSSWLNSEHNGGSCKITL